MYAIRSYYAGLLQKIHAVSVEWQKERNYDELVFSQGIFDSSELKQQTLMTIEDAEEKILAFANIIPDYQPGDATYDLIRNAKGSSRITSYNVCYTKLLRSFLLSIISK